MPVPTLIMIPTYNEAENVGRVSEEILALGLDADLLFIDDNSPDGTGRLLDDISNLNPRVKVMHRPGKLGVGSAHLDGINWAYDHDYVRLITMDSDLTHSPADIHRMLAEAEHADVVVGSRFMREQSLAGWLWWRKAMTHAGNILTNVLLGLTVDATGAFRVYNLHCIPRAIFEMVESRGYNFFYESLHRLSVNGVSVREIPIDLPARTYGHSKMRINDVIQGILFLLNLGLITRCNRRSLLMPAASEARETTEAQAKQDWDAYWSGKDKPTLAIYDFIAGIYRNWIIRPALNHFLGREFSPSASLLHAGCGSGMVDVDAFSRYRITALDLSPKALNVYAQHHGGSADLLEGSILAIPAAEECFDGVFNLGVMEHFEEDQVIAALKEFHRVLKPGGKIVLFWPPVYGLATNALKLIHVVLRRVLRKDIKLHPDELTHVTTQARTKAWLRKAGFDLRQSYFGPRDAFTHEIIIGVKATTGN